MDEANLQDEQSWRFSAVANTASADGADVTQNDQWWSMFDRYTELARRTLFYARFEAGQLGGNSIETEHLLLGLIRESGATVGRILVDAGLAYRAVRQSIEGLTKHRLKSQIPTSVEIPISGETQRVLQYAAEEADGLGHRQIGTEHLLLGLLREHGTIAEHCLAQNGLSLDRLRKQIRGEGVSFAGEPPIPSRIEASAALERVSALLDQIRSGKSGTRTWMNLSALSS